MKTAREMFEELGYELVQNDIKDIIYTKLLSDGKTTKIKIYFHYYHKWFEKYIITPLEMRGAGITIEELKAINQQCKELGWLDEKINND